MIVHSSANRLDGSCDVSVEWSNRDRPGDVDLKAFAVGAAARHNAGHNAVRATVVHHTDNGHVISPGYDTSDANGALVNVTIEATS